VIEVSTRKINLKDKLSLITDYWAPRVVAEMNDVQFKLVKFKGEFVWHDHKETDEVFFVIEGVMRSDEALDVMVVDSQGAHDIAWLLDGHIVGTMPDLHLQHLQVGCHILNLTYRDAQAQSFAITTLVRVLEPGLYAATAAEVQAAIYLPLWEEDSEIYLPSVQR
jgi:hypothetical protein